MAPVEDLCRDLVDSVVGDLPLTYFINFEYLSLVLLPLMHGELARLSELSITAGKVTLVRALTRVNVHVVFQVCQ